MSDWNTTEGWNSGFSGAASGAQAGLSVGGPIGAVVGGITGGLSGLFGHKKKTDWNKKYFRESVRQFNIQDEYNKNQMQYRVKDAIKAGVNPIAALGGSGGHYSPTISAGGSSGGDNEQSSNFGGFMSSVSDMITARREQKQNRAIELQAANLDLEGKRLQNDILRQKLIAEAQPGVPVNSMPKNPNWRIPMDYNLRDVVPGKLFLPWEDMQGNIHWFINPDSISDADYSNIEADRAIAIGARGATMGIQNSWKRNRKRITRDTVNTLWYGR